MSYHIIKSIKVDEKEGKVYITGADNNVRPRTPHRWECTSLSQILVEQGREAVDLEILEAYESGDFQGGNNKWTRALVVLRRMPEYAQFNWRGEPYDEITERRKTPAFKAILKKALETKLPKAKFIITKSTNMGTKVYLKKLTARHVFWSPVREKAKIFRFIEDTEDVKRVFYGSNSWAWAVEQVENNQRRGI
ncbi:MAG: hypothetical protein A2X99_02300 [Deltaproteobacteria bacterium GWB2_55_19]|nr:MAG: hypothetical protein A2X99_02300 [Deltaproteobacteria bacterium GWB2_55_19]